MSTPGGRDSPGRGLGFAWLFPCQGASVLSGSIWILPSPLYQVAPGQGSPIRCCMEESLAPARLYNHWANLLLIHTGIPPVTPLIGEGLIRYIPSLWSFT